MVVVKPTYIDELVKETRKCGRWVCKFSIARNSWPKHASLYLILVVVLHM